MKKLALAVVLCAPFSVVNASEVTGSGELGATVATGNTDVQTINAKLALDYKLNKDWDSHTKFDLLTSNSANVQTSEKYELDYQANYIKEDNLSYFGALNLRTDRFSGVKLSTGLTAGVSYTVVKNEKTEFKSQVGAGYRTVTDTTNVDISEAIVTALLNYSNKLSGTTHLTSDLSLESGNSNTLSKFNIGVEVKLDSDLALKYNIGSITNSTVLSGIKNTDILQTVNLVYGF